MIQNTVGRIYFLSKKLSGLSPIFGIFLESNIHVHSPLTDIVEDVV